jgi:hypothetical protein
MLIPIMASRLMLSLRKAAAEPATTCTITSTVEPGLSVISRTVRYPSRAPGGVSGDLLSASFFDEVVELGCVTRTAPKDDYGFQADTPPASRLPSDGMD